jgi:hypothetical protein
VRALVAALQETLQQFQPTDLISELRQILTQAQRLSDSLRALPTSFTPVNELSGASGSALKAELKMAIRKTAKPGLKRD